MAIVLIESQISGGVSDSVVGVQKSTWDKHSAVSYHYDLMELYTYVYNTEIIYGFYLITFVFRPFLFEAILSQWEKVSMVFLYN